MPNIVIVYDPRQENLAQKAEKEIRLVIERLGLSQESIVTKIHAGINPCASVGADPTPYIIVRDDEKKRALNVGKAISSSVGVKKFGDRGSQFDVEVEIIARFTPCEG